MKKWCVLLACLLLFGTLCLHGAAGEAKTINVRDYGATAAAGTDQTAFFTAALADAAAGDTVLVPAGTYEVSSILLPSGIHFTGESRENTVLLATQAGSTVLSLRLGSDITVSSLTVDGNMTAKHLVYLKSGDNNTVENVTMRNVPHGSLVTGLYINGRCRGTVVRGCRFENIGVRPSGDETEDKGTGLLIYGNKMFSFPHDDDVLIENNVFDTIGRTGIAADQVADVRIIGNLIKNTGYVIGKGMSIELYGSDCRRCIIENNTVDHWMSIHGQCHAVRHNRIGTDFFEDESYFKRYAIENIASDIVYADNTLAGGNKYGINDLGTGCNILYTDITVTGCAQAAYSANSCEAVGNKTNRYFYNCSFAGTSRNTEQAIYPSSSGIGAEINDKVTELVFDHVSFTDNALYGLHCKGVSGFLELRDCTLTGNKRTGFVHGQTNPMELTNTVILSNGSLRADGSYSGDAHDALTPFTTAAPAALFTPSTAVCAPGETIYFTNESLTPEGTALDTFLWDFGAGLPQTGEDASFTFTEPGSYTVSLVVWNDAGRGDIVQQVILVQAQAPTEPPTEAPTEPPTEAPTDAPTEPPAAKQSFLDRLKAFFKSILDWLRGLFG